MNQIMKVNFHGTALYGSKFDGTVFVALKPIVEAMGLAWQSQLQRVKRDPILREGITVMVIPTPQGPQKSVGLRLNLIHGWLFTISSLRIKSADVREKVQLFQRECFDVLWEQFSGRKNNQGQSIQRRWIDLIHEARLLFGRPAAVQLWRLLGMPEVPEMQEAFKQIELFGRKS